MLTRKEYMESCGDGPCRHHEYYTQFVTQSVIDTLLRTFGEKAIKESTDEHFNDLPLRIWDGLPLYTECDTLLRKAGDFSTLSGKVCIYKAAAQTIRDRSIVLSAT